MKFIDLTWKKFGRLTVIYRWDNDSRQQSRWICRCNCGVEKTVMWCHLKSWHTTSCWCYQKYAASKAKTIHWLRKHPLYNVWLGINKRCYNVNEKQFSDYGWRWITVCSRWKRSFKLFYTDMIEWYEKWLHIDRINNSKWYSPNNCRWVTQKDNNRNTRSNIIIQYKWESHCISEWCEILGLKYTRVLYRINNWWEVERAFKINN